MKNKFLKKGAVVAAAAAFAVGVVPTMAFADNQSSSGGSSEVTSQNIEAGYEKDCTWTVTYPTSVTMASNDDGSASADIDFVVKGRVDVDHKFCVDPSSTSINLTGEKHGASLSCTLTGGNATGTAVNGTDGATVTCKAAVAADAIENAAVDNYKGTVTFKLQCCEPITKTFCINGLDASVECGKDGTWASAVGNHVIHEMSGDIGAVTIDDNGNVFIGGRQLLNGGMEPVLSTATIEDVFMQ